MSEQTEIIEEAHKETVGNPDESSKSDQLNSAATCTAEDNDNDEGVTLVFDEENKEEDETIASSTTTTVISPTTTTTPIISEEEIKEPNKEVKTQEISEKIPEKIPEKAESPPEVEIVMMSTEKYDIPVIEEDNKLKQNDKGTLLSRGGEFQADETNTNTNDLALKDLQTTSDIRFFICGSCKNNPILIGSTPKLLPCLHSFCENCLQDRYEKQKQQAAEGAISSPPRLKCPSCGQEFLVAANDHPTSGFLNNQFVIESTPTTRNIELDNHHQCTSCDDRSTASSYCMNCNEWLCDVCVSAHQRVKVTKDHIIQTKSSYNSSVNSTPSEKGNQENPTAGNSKEKPLFCKVHSQEQLRLFCANCDKLTCRDCQLVEHKDHRYQFIDEAASKHREILKKLLQYLQINLGLLKETIVEVEKVSDALGSQESEIEAEINKAFTCLIEAMKTRQETLVKELRILVTNKQALLAKQKKDLTQMRVILEHNHDFAEFAVKGGSNVALLYSRKVLGTRLHNLNSLKYRQRPLAFPDLKFSMDVEKLCAYFSKIGAAYSHEDMQRKIDHYHSKGPQNNIPRTIALSSRQPTKGLPSQSPIESMTAINQRLTSEPMATTTTPYINLSKQGSLGLPGHQTIRSSNSPNMYNYNTHRSQSTSSNQDMIVLSSSHNKTVTNNDPNHLKKDFATKYMQQVKDKNGRNPNTPKTPTYDTNKMKTHQMNYQMNSQHNNYPRSSSVNSTQSQHAATWSKINPIFGTSKNSTIDQLKKMVEGAGSSDGNLTTDNIERPVSARSTGSDPGPGQTGALSANGIVLVKQENHSPDNVLHSVGASNNDDHSRSESGFDEGQNNEDYCGVCRNGGQLLCCDTCPKVYHLNCHIPALSDLPRDSWSCGLCVEIGQEAQATTPLGLGGQKRRYSKEMTEWQYKLCEKILLCLSVHADSLPFHHKVSKIQVPDYYKVISTPMDLMTVRSKLSPQNFEHYRGFQDFIVDIRLIFSNCFKYNSADSDVCKMGVRLEKYFDSLLKKYVPDAEAYPDTEGQAKRQKTEEVFA